VCGSDVFCVVCELTANLSELMCCLGFGRISVPGRTRSTALDHSRTVSAALSSYRPCSTVIVPSFQYFTSTGSYTTVAYSSTSTTAVYNLVVYNSVHYYGTILSSRGCSQVSENSHSDLTSNNHI
jgi:hypothetical protein